MTVRGSFELCMIVPAVTEVLLAAGGAFVGEGLSAVRPGREYLTLDGKKALKTLLAANKRLNTAYMLKESFGQLWSYEREGWARRFFENGGVQA